MNKWKSFTLGTSVQERSVEAFEFGSSGRCLHIYGGIHGDEPESVDVLTRLIEVLKKDAHLYKDKHVYVIPNLNPDGGFLKTRVNANKVDLNRNFPSKNWSSQFELLKNNPGKEPLSEPETKLLQSFIKKHPPQAVLSIHSWLPQVNYDGPAASLAKKLSEATGYKVTDHIGYATKGSLGAWLGNDKNIPVVTLEVPEKTNFDTVWIESKEALLTFIKKA